MYAIDPLILLGATLLIVAILSNTLSGRIGVPGLVIFLAVGMLAGEDGLGGIAFDAYPIAHAVGTLALVLILFDGGLQSPWRSFRIAWKPAVTLATVGVVITAGITGVAASWILGIPLVVGLLLGSIAGSTDAAAEGEGVDAGAHRHRGSTVTEPLKECRRMLAVPAPTLKFSDRPGPYRGERASSSVIRFTIRPDMVSIS